MRPSFSRSSLEPWTTLRPRLTWVSDGKPLRRLLLRWKALEVVEVVVAWHVSTSNVDSGRGERITDVQGYEA